MSELFESLNFPLHPSSSPSTSTCHDVPQSKSKPSTKAIDGSRAATSSTITRNGKQTLNRSADIRDRATHLPKTPRALTERSSSSPSFRTLDDVESDRISPYAQHSAMTTPLSSSSTLLARPGHVYWHVTPSPSQQMRQNDFKKYLSNNSPILPLGSQAFRDEILQQAGMKGAGEDTLCRGTESSWSKGLDKGRRGAMERRMAVATAGGSGVSTATTSSSISNRRFTRRPSRRSTGVTGDTSTGDKSQGGKEEMQQLLADLDRHLKNHGNEMIDDVDLEIDLYPGPPSTEEQSLIDVLDRVFSQESHSTLHQKEDGRDKAANGKKEIRDQIEGHISSQGSPSNSREWSRTKSLPSGLQCSKSASGYQTNKCSKLHTSSKSVEQHQMARAREDASHTRCRDEERASIASAESSNTKTRTSPKKRAVLADLNPRQPSQIMKEKKEEVTATMTKSKSKTRSSSSSVSPTKKPTMRTPRIGLSRHSLGVGASQMTGSQQNGPSAPFKRPSKVNPALMVKRAANLMTEAPIEREAIIIYDSEEDDDGKNPKEIVPLRRTSPRKKSLANNLNSALKPVMTPASYTTVETRTSSRDVSMMTDEDSSFDTSMDDALLCDAVDQVEATQRAIRASQRKPSSPSIGEDDSFEMASSDNEALAAAMNAGGW